MTYTQKEKEKIFTKVCFRIESGEAVRTVLKDKDMPDSKTFYDWMKKDDKLLQQYARATTERAICMFEDMLDIADSVDGDVMIVDGKEVTNHHKIQRDRLRVDTRKWALSKLMPSKYGEKLDLTTDGEKLNSPKEIVIVSNGKDIKLK